MDVALLTQASASGRSELSIHTGSDGALTLALRRDGVPLLQAAALRGVRVARPASAPERSGPAAVALALADGAEIHVERHVTLDLFTVSVNGADGSDAVEVGFALEEVGPCYGIGHLMRQHWPLQQGALELGPFYPFDNGPNGLCTLAVPTVVGESGVAVSCDEQRTRCLHISLNAARTNVTAGKPYKWGVGVANFDRMILPRHASEAPGDGRLTLQSRAAYDWPHVLHPWLREAGDPAGDAAPPTLVFTVGAADDARTATEELVLGRVLEETPGGRPLPPEHLLRDPIWTTWAKYKDAVTQDDVLAFAGEIARRDLPRSVMEIDDRWSVKYGDLEFDAAKFPDPAAMTAKLHELGFLATLWIIPFANTDSTAVTSPETRDFFVKDIHGKVGEFDWWQPTRVAALDVTNPAACEWFISRLQRLQSCYDIDGFKFDAGEPSFLPRNAVTHTSLSCPSDYTRAWINNVAGHFPVSEARAGVPGTQSAAPLLRMFDRFSTWGDDNGLASVITALLTASILGYPLVLPDMIGGNAYDDEVPDAELMIRWAQASAAMPALQFSIPAWDLGESAAALTAASLRWRSSVFWPAIAAGLPAATAHFTPITRPMWWAAPRDAAAFATADQFMVGDDLVVAPVVVAGARARDRVYLPPGLWERVRLCGAGGDVMGCEGDAVGAPIRGPVTLRDVPAPLDDLPTWRRVVE